MCLGTNWGALHLLDHLGHSSQQQEFPTHGMAVKMVDIDSGGDYIASCSNDGKVNTLFEKSFKKRFFKGHIFLLKYRCW